MIKQESVIFVSPKRKQEVFKDTLLLKMKMCQEYEMTVGKCSLHFHLFLNKCIQMGSRMIEKWPILDGSFCGLFLHELNVFLCWTFQC